MFCATNISIITFKERKDNEIMQVCHAFENVYDASMHHKYQAIIS